MASHVFANPNFAKHAFPVLKMPGMVAVTISPPPDANLSSIREKVRTWIRMASLPCYFVMEYDANRRVHWHGAIGLSKQKVPLESFMKKEFKSLLEGLSFVDWQLPRSRDAWVNYTCKGIVHKIHYQRLTDENLYFDCVLTENIAGRTEGNHPGAA